MHDPANLPASVAPVVVERWDGLAARSVTEQVAEEVPLSLVYNGLSYAVMMATPERLEDFAYGFSLTEGIVADAAELRRVSVVPVGEGIEVHVDIPLERYLALEAQRRSLAGRTGCGLCGVQTLQQAVRHPPPVGRGPQIAPGELHRGFEALERGQRLNRVTGAVHAAGFLLPGEGVLEVCEDVGRHNALDKLIGSLLRRGLSPERGAVLITSRASFEMVQKVAVARACVLAAISAPTNLAVRLAHETGITLVGFARSGAHNTYAGTQRLRVPDAP